LSDEIFNIGVLWSQKTLKHMVLSTLDWVIIIGYFVISLLIGIMASRGAGKDSSEFFLSGRSMPWWLLGISLVATTFSADTPNLVTDIVRNNGVSGNWVWWAFLLTGMLTVFVYAKLWRRSGILTDLEFYEMRYSGPPATFLRGFRAIYLGVFFNVMIMATVCLAAIKIGGVMLNISPIQTLLISSVVTVAYTSFGGLRGVIWTDFFQFVLAMIGTVWAAFYVVDLPQVGGIDALLSHPAVIPKLGMLPDFNKPDVYIPLFLIPIAVQWWSVWYPGAEPGGGGYVVQRMLSAKDEQHAVWATFAFNIMHYALRPWPWIFVALASLIVFPDLASLAKAFPHLDPKMIKDDLAYPAMLTFLPAGLIGLLIAALVSAFMSTISTHLNWGSSYIVNDFYKRFVKPEASETELVNVGRFSTVFLMILAALLALKLENALQAFNILLQVGAGTGLLFILRWFWWRINAWCEIAAMFVSFIVAFYFQFYGPEGMADWEKLLIGVGITTLTWVIVAFTTTATDSKTLTDFYKMIRPAGNGWNHVKELGLKQGTITKEEAQSTGSLTIGLICMFLGTCLVYAALFGTGYLFYGQILYASIGLIISVICGIFIYRLIDKI
jgi:solute:Na+ symporter, SSS family